MDQSDSLKLLEIITQEEKEFRNTFHRAFTFLSVFLSTIFLGVISASINIKINAHYFLLIMGPAIVFIVAQIGVSITENYIRRTLETITIRAKIEQKLGLTKPGYNSSGYWSEESLFPGRYIKGRNSFKSSNDFVDKLSKKGISKHISRLFRLFQIMSVILTIGLIYMGTLASN